MRVGAHVELISLILPPTRWENRDPTRRGNASGHDDFFGCPNALVFPFVARR
jgi:hypothetical protein